MRQIDSFDEFVKTFPDKLPKYDQVKVSKPAESSILFKSALILGSAALLWSVARMTRYNATLSSPLKIANYVEKRQENGSIGWQIHRPLLDQSKPVMEQMENISRIKKQEWTDVMTTERAIFWQHSRLSIHATLLALLSFPLLSGLLTDHLSVLGGSEWLLQVDKVKLRD